MSAPQVQIKPLLMQREQSKDKLMEPNARMRTIVYLFAALAITVQTSAQNRVITFNAPGGVHGTEPASINPAGVITGTYSDSNHVGHGFLRAPDGTFTTFDAPGLFTVASNSINRAGAITGYYYDANNAVRGFLRARDGNITTFDASGAGYATYAFSINAAGAITGYYNDANAAV